MRRTMGLRRTIRSRVCYIPDCSLPSCVASPVGGPALRRTIQIWCVLPLRAATLIAACPCDSPLFWGPGLRRTIQTWVTSPRGIPERSLPS